MLLDWGGVDIAGILGRRTGLPVHLGNDATLAPWPSGAWAPAPGSTTSST